MEMIASLTAFNAAHPFIFALVSPGPSPELGDFAQVYAPFIGTWNVDAVDYATDGTQQRSQGEWHFAWVLEGRAVQDIWICPGRDQRSQGMSKANNRYGTTIRTFDQDTHQWKITWFNPVSGAHNELLAHNHIDRIEHMGRDDKGGLLRWSFSDIQPRSFYWCGEYSKDGGKSWTKQAEFFATRK
jgi:uncharacterized protein